MRCLDENELAERWGITARTLQSWRATWADGDSDKVGPPFVRVGKRRIVYRGEDIVAYEVANTVGKLPPPNGWQATVKRAAGTLSILARQARTDRSRAMLEAIRDELRDLLPLQS